MRKETWVSVKGAEGMYEVSDFGNVRSVERLIHPIGRQPYKRPGKLLSPVNNGNGYLSVFVGANRRGYVHRIVLVSFMGEIVGKPHVNHKDGNKSNNSLNNLEWCTHAENVRHAFDTGLNTGHDMSGVNNPRFKRGNRCRSSEKRTCVFCGTTYVTKYVTDKYCNKTCSSKHSAQKLNSRYNTV